MTETVSPRVPIKCYLLDPLELEPEYPLVPELLPDEPELVTRPLLQPLLNSVRSIVPSWSVSTLLKSLTKGCAWDIVIVDPFDGFAWFHNVAHSACESFIGELDGDAAWLAPARNAALTTIAVPKKVFANIIAYSFI